MSFNRRNDPEWLESVKVKYGDSPLLSRAECEYIAKVRRLIIQEYGSKPTLSIPHNQHPRNKLSVMKNNFEEVVTYLKERSERKEYFVATYPAWRTVRDMSVIQLKNIADAVDKNKKEYAAQIGSGSAISVVGGLLCLVPGIAALRFAGGVIWALGSMSTAAASLKEAEVLKEKVKEAEKVISEDKTFSDMLWKWVNDASHMEEAHKKIIKLAQESEKNIARDLYAYFKGECNTGDLGKRIRQTLDLYSLKISPKAIDEAADIIAILITIYMLFDRYRPLFNLVLKVYECKLDLCAAFNVIASVASVASVVNASKSNFSFKKSRIGIGIVLDIINIMRAAKDEESVCVESAEIAKAAESLRKEAKIFENVYYAVQRA